MNAPSVLAFGVPPSPTLLCATGPHAAPAATRRPALPLPLSLLSIAAVGLVLRPQPAASLGVYDGLLSDCQPARISCVSSQDDSPASFLEPWQYDDASHLARIQQNLISILTTRFSATLVHRQPRYLTFEIRQSKLDVLEFYFPDADNIVHFRSARQDASFDFFANRRRLDRVRVMAGLSQIAVLRNRLPFLGLFETPFDSFGPSAVDVDAIIDNRGIGSRPVR